jgi:hypothetical protein
MITHLDFQGPASGRLSSVVGESILPHDIFGFLVVSERLIDQLFTIFGSDPESVTHPA